MLLIESLFPHLAASTPPAPRWLLPSTMLAVSHRKEFCTPCEISRLSFSNTTSVKSCRTHRLSKRRSTLQLDCKMAEFTEEEITLKEEPIKQEHELIKDEVIEMGPTKSESPAPTSNHLSSPTIPPRSLAGLPHPPPPVGQSLSSTGPTPATSQVPPLLSTQAPHQGGPPSGSLHRQSERPAKRRR